VYAIRMTWWDYVQQVTGGASQAEIAHRLGISPSSVGRWKTSDPKPESVRTFAVEYRRPVAEAFVAAGYLQPADIGHGESAAPGPPKAMSVEEAAETIWSLKAVPEGPRRRLILELLERAGRVGE
jgi:hypothetical protein